MGIAEIFSQIADGLASFAPALGKAIWTLFLNLFLTSTTTEAGVVTVTGINVLGSFAIATLVMGIVYKVLPMAINWISKKASARRRRKARA
ncbi:MAG: hypothetical protein OSJ74_08605 [Clostridia bacterium]|nr:hypothetical protein [Clostridia bacterium]